MPGMPSTNTDLQNLQAARSALINTLAQEMAYQKANGPKPSYTLDGENYQWAEWLAAVQVAIDKFNILIQIEGGVFEYRTQGMT